MHTLVLTSMLFNSIGLVAIVVALTLSYCLPARHHIRTWALDDTNPASPVITPEAAPLPAGETAVPHAA